VKGIILKDELVERLTVSTAKELIKDVGPGMKTKLQAAIDAAENGIDPVIISSGELKHPVKRSLEHRNCTVITK
jgi:acetylglutamate kinase